MSYSYQYVDYPNPTTPRVYTWEIEQDPMQLPVQPQDQHTLQVFQQQQQHVLQHQQQQQPQPQVVYEPPPTIQLQERKPPSQFRFDNITEEHFIQAAASASSDETRRGTSKPPLHVSTASRTGTVSPGASSAGAGPSAMPQRIPHARHTQSAHPYRRLPGAGPGAVAQRARRESEMYQQQQQQQPPQAGPSSMSMPAPDVLSGMATQCPAADSWRENVTRQPEGPGPAASTSPDAGSPTHVQTPVPHAQGQAHDARPYPQAPPQRRYAIRADVHYDAEENVMTAMLELPGLKKSDLRLTLAVCPYSRVRQLTVSGTSRPTLPPHGHTVQERKFGAFARTIVVPPDTKPEDVVAVMEDGILTLKIPSGQPAEPEQPQDIAIQ
ncbi:hypothetical protein B0H21DRAFT_29349 [Amylocystis lapponica]|nr:hypothetical protein B0H21DRAFT_29349 [Amylocystis lapponica]